MALGLAAAQASASGATEDDVRQAVLQSESDWQQAGPVYRRALPDALDQAVQRVPALANGRGVSPNQVRDGMLQGVDNSAKTHPAAESLSMCYSAMDAAVAATFAARQIPGPAPTELRIRGDNLSPA